MSGFSLIEIIITSAILSFMVLGIYATLNVADMAWNVDMGILELQQEARQALDGMAREIRQAKPTDVTIGEGGTTVQFKVPIDITADPEVYSDTIKYSLNGCNQIIRKYPASDMADCDACNANTGPCKILGNDITALSFQCVGGVDCASSRILQIQVRANKTVKGKPLSFPPSADNPFTEQVRLRN
ncbi:MAG: type II secretion system protein J [Deltaproteobacteria bacterium]